MADRGGKCMPGPTLDDLEGVVWGEPTFPSGLVTRCHELRRKPVSEFTLADIRLLIGQSISLPILMPRALAALGADPLVEAFYYPGDLLSAVVRADRAFWQQHPELLTGAHSIAERAAIALCSGTIDLDPATRSALLVEVEGFLQREGVNAPPPSASCRPAV
jgi:CDI immunity proteins